MPQCVLRAWDSQFWANPSGHSANIHFHDFQAKCWDTQEPDQGSQANRSAAWG